MRTLYIKSNKLLRTFHCCTIDVKLELFRSFCMSFYCYYLWTTYKKINLWYIWYITFGILHVAFNNTYRSVLKLHWRRSASAICMLISVQHFEAVIRKSIIV